MKIHKEGHKYSCTTSPEGDPTLVLARGEYGLSYMVRVEPAFVPPDNPIKFLPGVILKHQVGIRPHIRDDVHFIQFEVSTTGSNEKDVARLKAGIAGMMAVINAFDDPEAAAEYFYPE